MNVPEHKRKSQQYQLSRLDINQPMPTKWSLNWWLIIGLFAGIILFIVLVAMSTSTTTR